MSRCPYVLKLRIWYLGFICHLFLVTWFLFLVTCFLALGTCLPRLSRSVSVRGEMWSIFHWGFLPLTSCFLLLVSYFLSLTSCLFPLTSCLLFLGSWNWIHGYWVRVWMRDTRKKRRMMDAGRGTKIDYRSALAFYLVVTTGIDFTFGQLEKCMK